MATYIALLRGINIGGNPLKMRRLRLDGQTVKTDALDSSQSV